MTLPKNHKNQIETGYEALLVDESKVAITNTAISNNKHSLNQVLRNVELLTKAITNDRG
jgi:hypothetical protein